MTAVVILNYNGLKLLQQYLPTVISYTPGADIVIADNGSTDQSAEWIKQAYPDIRLIEFDSNLGFAEGYNQALKQIDAENYLLLNSDVRVTPGWLATMEQFMRDNPDCMACQPKILSEKDNDRFEYAGAAGGFIDIFGYPFCRGRIMNTVEHDTGQYDTDSEIFWASGACLMIRKAEFWAAGGFDGRFFAHQEEIDLCWRLKARGKSIRCVSSATVYHVGGGSLGYESPFKTKLNFRNNALLLFKNLPDSYYRYVRPARIILDYIAAMQMLFSGHKANAKAVMEARKEFRKIKKEFKTDRVYNLQHTVNKRPACMLNSLLIWQYYVLGKKKFSQIKQR